MTMLQDSGSETGPSAKLQFTRLAKPFPDALIHEPSHGKHGVYVEHNDYNQKLLLICGPFDFRLVQPVRDHDSGQIVGVIAELTVEIDGRRVSVQEAGDCEQPGNWKNDGARLKDASSDAFKRCCMRLGLGLHLWAEGSYFLYDFLLQQESVEQS